MHNSLGRIDSRALATIHQATASAAVDATRKHQARSFCAGLFGVTVVDTLAVLGIGASVEDAGWYANM